MPLAILKSSAIKSKVPDREGMRTFPKCSYSQNQTSRFKGHRRDTDGGQHPLLAGWSHPPPHLKSSPTTCHWQWCQYIPPSKHHLGWGRVKWWVGSEGHCIRDHQHPSCVRHPKCTSFYADSRWLKIWHTHSLSMHLNFTDTRAPFWEPPWALQLYLKPCLLYTFIRSGPEPHSSPYKENDLNLARTHV